MNRPTNGFHNESDFGATKCRTKMRKEVKTREKRGSVELELKTEEMKKD
jgi:hypothetical protein